MAPRSTEDTGRPLPTVTWLAGLLVRSLFILALIFITARVASPQVERLSTLYETPSEVIRVLLGLIACVWLAVHLFILPKDSGGFRVWTWLGVVLLPLAALCMIYVW